jgi:hypothetical protein
MMKDSLLRALLLLVLVCLGGMATLRAASVAEVNPTGGRSPLTPLTFLIGGVWHAALPDGPDGENKSLDLRAEWMPNRHGISFESEWVTGKKHAPYTDGFYAWDAARRQIVFFYADDKGELIQGFVTRDDVTLVHEFTITDKNGKVTSARARLTPTGKDTYTNEIFLAKDGGWEKAVEVLYVRDFPDEGKRWK